MQKKTYAAPQLLAHGKLESLTQGNSGTSKLDAAFPVSTPFSDLTFT